MKFITHESQVFLNKGVSVIYFYTDWFLFHQKIKIMIDIVEQEYKKIKFYAVDISSFNNAISRYNLKTLPTLIIFKEGREIRRISNLISTQVFTKIFRDIYNSYGDNDGKEK